MERRGLKSVREQALPELIFSALWCLRVWLVLGFLSLAGGEVVDLAAGKAGLEAEVEGVEAALLTETGLLAAAVQSAAVADVEFVLEDDS